LFLAHLKNCENVVAFLQYNNQTAAAVDYIMFNFDNFSIGILYGHVLLKKAAMYAVKMSSFCSGTDQRNKHICLLLKTKVCKTTTGFSHYEKPAELRRLEASDPKFRFKI
jgi:hypothetical protein